MLNREGHGTDTNTSIGGGGKCETMICVIIERKRGKRKESERLAYHRFFFNRYGTAPTASVFYLGYHLALPNILQVGAPPLASDVYRFLFWSTLFSPPPSCTIRE